MVYLVNLLVNMSYLNIIYLSFLDVRNIFLKKELQWGEACMFRQGRIEIEGIEVILSKSYYLVKRKLCFYLLQFMPGLEMIMLLPCVLHGRQQASCIGLGTH